VDGVDLFAAATVVVMAIFGARRGLIASVLSLAAVAVGAVIGSRLAPEVLPGGAHSRYTPLAGLVGALVLALATLSLKTARLLVVGAWTIAVLLAVPLGALPYKLGWENWTWLPPASVAARFYIWKYVADEVYERPLTGIGIRGSRDLHLKIPSDAADPSHNAYALKGREARHPHNIYLQTWVELGAIGAVLLLCVGLAGLWVVSAWPPLFQGSAYALFAIASAVGLSGFDFWQTWMLGALAFAWSEMLLAFRLPAFATLLADRANPTTSAGGKAALRATIA